MVDDFDDVKQYDLVISPFHFRRGGVSSSN